MELTGGRDRSVMDVMDFIADPKKDEVEAANGPGWMELLHSCQHMLVSNKLSGKTA